MSATDTISDPVVGYAVYLFVFLDALEHVIDFAILHDSGVAIARKSIKGREYRFDVSKMCLSLVHRALLLFTFSGATRWGWRASSTPRSSLSLTHSALG